MTKRILRCQVEFTPIYYVFFYIRTARFEKMNGVHAAIRRLAAKWVKRKEKKRREEKRREGERREEKRKEEK